MPGPYPLVTLGATVDVNGISAPTYVDIFSSLQASYRLIYGQDIALDEDTQDGQWLGILAKSIDDANAVAINTYNQFSPVTAVGVGLSSNVKLNGIERLSPSYSSVVLTCVGQAGTRIVAGLVGDDMGLGTQWNIQPPIVTIPLSGTIDVTAVCNVPGAITVPPNSLINIVNPQPNWQSVTNNFISVPGAPLESDSRLKQRQQISTNKAAQTPTGSILAAVENTSGVIRAVVHENFTNQFDLQGVPPHSIACVIQGGFIDDIVTAIALSQSPGTYTIGNVEGAYLDPKGVPTTIAYYILQLVPAYFAITMTAFQGYSSQFGAILLDAVGRFINNLPIGQIVEVDKLWAPANLSGTAALQSANALYPNQIWTQTTLDLMSNTYRVTSILIGYNPGAVSAADMNLNFAQAATSSSAYGVLTVVI